MTSEENIIDAIVNLDEPTVLRIANQLVKRGVNPLEILEKCRQGMSMVGKKFETGEFFLSEMIMAAEIFNQVMGQIRPELTKNPAESKGMILMGTVEGDVHDIGKNIVITLLEAEGYAVVDLGVDVSSERFVEAIKEHKPDIVGMSSLLTVALESTKKTVEAIKEAGLRDSVKIIIGGGRVDSQAAEYIIPDAYTDNAALGVKLIRQLVGGEAP